MGPKAKVITAPEYDYLHSGPILFLAGPIQGTDDWQSEAIKLLHEEELDSRVLIANPRRPNFDTSPEGFYAQVAWETHYLTRAFKLFWCADETQHVCERAYAQTTRFELGEHWRERGNISIGFAPKFSGERYVRTRVQQSGMDIPMFKTLKETCALAVQLLNRRMTNNAVMDVVRGVFND